MCILKCVQVQLNIIPLMAHLIFSWRDQVSLVDFVNMKDNVKVKDKYGLLRGVK